MGERKRCNHQAVRPSNLVPEFLACEVWQPVDKWAISCTFWRLSCISTFRLGIMKIELPCWNSILLG